MKKSVLFCLSLILFLGACSSVDYTARKKFTGIDYSAYENPVILPTDTLAANEDFTSEEIAASYGRYTDVTVVAAAKRVKLGSAANSKNMALFQKALDAAYKKALRTYRPAGFTYSIASVGAVNPLSDIEVSCILSEQAANEIGQPTCNLFFQTIVEQYNNLLREAKENAAL